MGSEKTKLDLTQYQNIVEFAKEGTFAVDVRGNVVLFNGAAEVILRKNRDEVLQQPYALNFFEFEENDNFNQVLLDAVRQSILTSSRIVDYYDGQTSKLLLISSFLLHATTEAGLEEKTGVIIVFSEMGEYQEITKAIQSVEKYRTLNEEIEYIAQREQGQAILHLEKIQKKYVIGEVVIEALADTTVDVYDGELLVILGPSGSGKSTLLNLMGGMEQPSAGKIVFNAGNGQSDLDLSRASEREMTIYRRQQVGFIFQFYNLIPDLTAAENVALAAELAEDPLPLAEVLEEVGLGSRHHHFPSQMSGGEQQRVAIARAIIKKPRILFCDEPTGALDSKTGKIVLELLTKVAARQNITVVIVTHNNALAMLANRVMKMRSGRLVEVIYNPRPLPADKLDL